MIETIFDDKMSLIAFNLFLEIVLKFVNIGGFNFQWFSSASDFADNGGHAINFSDPLVDVGLVPIDIVFNESDIFDDFSGVFGHDLYFPHEIALLLHVQLLQSKHQFVFVLK